MAPTRAVVLAFCVALAAVACSGGDDDESAPAPPSAPALRGTPVGTQVSWFLEASRQGTISAADYEARFSPDFRTAVPLDQLVASLTAGPYELVEVRPGRTPNYLSAVVRQAGTDYVLTATVDAAATGSPLKGLSLARAGAAPDSPGGRPATWEEIDARVAALAPRYGLVVSEVDSRGGCASLHRLAPDDPQPLASLSKLYVLGALGEAIRTGRAAWGQQIPVTPELATLLSGVVQDEPAGTMVPVRDLAALMISISDNTATDHVIDLVGRPEVEAQLGRFNSSDPFVNLPFITIGESFALQLLDYPTLADQWRAASTEQRRTMLTTPPLAGAKATLSDAAGWTDPRWTGIGWFGSPADVCNALGGLHAQAADGALTEVDTVMSINDGGLGLDPAVWETTWFKGGSEPGVFALAYLAEHADGRVIVAVLLLANESGALDEAAIGPEALTLVRAAYGLVA